MRLNQARSVDSAIESFAHQYREKGAKCMREWLSRFGECQILEVVQVSLRGCKFRHRRRASVVKMSAKGIEEKIAKSAFTITTTTSKNTIFMKNG